MNHYEKIIEDCLTNFKGKTFSSNEQVMEHLKNDFKYIWQAGYLAGERTQKEIEKFNKYHNKTNGKKNT